MNSIIPVERAERFEEGDARFLSRWKLYSQNQDTYYRGVGNGYFNWGGLTTTEVYLIKAELPGTSGTRRRFHRSDEHPERCAPNPVSVPKYTSR